MNSRFPFNWEQVRRSWRGLLDAAEQRLRPRVAADLPAADAEKVRALMEECLQARGGEVSARQRAALLGELYLTLDGSGRRNFLQTLATHFDVDRERVRSCAGALLGAEDEGFPAAAGALRSALVPPRQRLLRQFNALPQGVKFLVDLRADLLAVRPVPPELAALDRDLQELLATWFDVGLLAVERISWQSPAALLEKLMAYEAVHAIGSWSDLHNRLESDRRCYAFFHPGMSAEPLIFIEVALVEGLATGIQELLDEDSPESDPEQADTAIFYSISNTQKGLQGISFGPFLIKQVVTLLRGELPGLKTFSTLSPIPGFRSWLERYLEAAAGAEPADPALAALQAARQKLALEGPATALFDLPQWWQNEEVAELLREPLLALCARYLHETRTGTHTPLDPVARFHLGNGARIERINWLGDLSPKGMGESCGLMVNYLYPLKEIEVNIEGYAAGEVAAAARVRNLLRDDEQEQGQLARLRRLLSPGRRNGGDE